MRLIAILALILSTTAAQAQTQADPEAATGLTVRPAVEAQEHMIVAAHPLASKAGGDMLARGGSAADAAIAALLVLNVVEPQSSGIGGGAFALVHGPDGLTSWDARETAPDKAAPDMFMEGGAPLPFLEAVASGRSVGVPGLVRLMEVLHARHGKLPWEDLFAPAIDYAEHGFAVTPRLAASVARFAGRLEGTDAAEVFLPGGKPLQDGQVFCQPNLAATLQHIADNRADAFYSGDVPREILAALARGPRPSAMTEEDFLTYTVIERPPVCHPFAALRICGMGPPSSGATTVGQILMLMTEFERADVAEGQAGLWHLFAEASRLAYADRAKYLGDSDFVKVPVKGLLDPAYIASRAALIDPRKASAGKAEAGEPPWREGRLYAPDQSQTRPGTTHLSVIDRDGLAISLTASIETAFGSGRMAGGVLLNNQLTDFSFRPEDAEGTPIANAVAPGKRPRSSMSPTIFYEGDRIAGLTGSPGGSRIPEYVAKHIVSLWFSTGPDEAAVMAMPHVSHRNRGAITLEPGMAAEVVEALRALGHSVEEAPMTSGLHTIIARPDGTLVGLVDPRREGQAIGR
ncbi:MAG: gamma-glutamyltransferase [Pseudomonadota bacterium]